MPILQANQQFRGFEVQEFLAHGLSGEVYRARDKDDNQVALKVCNPKQDQIVLAYFTNEPQLLRELHSYRRHPHIVEYVDSNFRKTPFHLATRYVRGAHLHSLMGMPLPPGFVVTVVAQVASALDCLHYSHPHLSPIVHRDVNPRNVLIDEDGKAILIDLSIARRKGYHRWENDSRMGTPGYMAPEHDSGKEVPATDQFALAAMALRMLCGHGLLVLPVLGTTTRRIQELHAAGYARVYRLLGPRKQTAEVIARALKLDPRDRYASCEEFAYELRQALIRDSQPVVPTQPPRRSSGERLGYLSMVILALLAIEILLIWLANR
ncbi:MAG: serine/threonine protein kinase [Roseiflexaceae bacterium]